MKRRWVFFSKAVFATLVGIVLYYCAPSLADSALFQVGATFLGIVCFVFVGRLTVDFFRKIALPGGCWDVGPRSRQCRSTEPPQSVRAVPHPQGKDGMSGLDSTDGSSSTSSNRADV